MPQVRTSVPGTNKTGDPDFLHAAPDKTACAAFSKESRMKLANATKPHRKSGGSPPQPFANQSAKSNRNISFSAQVRFGEPGAPVQFLMGSVTSVPCTPLPQPASFEYMEPKLAFPRVPCSPKHSRERGGATSQWP